MLKFDQGGCYSACTLAYVGGVFRYLSHGSHFGVHRFAFSQPQSGESDVAQVASAAIVSYLQSMGIDTTLFTLSTQAGPSEINELPVQTLQRLNVVNNGFNAPVWSVESNAGVVYLKGQRDTVYGINKFMLYCAHRGSMNLYTIFDPQGREDMIMGFPAHSLVIDGNTQPISPIYKEIVNGWFNAIYPLTRAQIRAIAHARSVGVTVQGGYDAPTFLGFYDMPFLDGSTKLVGLLNMCGIAVP